MKVIDLLNKIANNEEVPETIKYSATIYHKYNQGGYFYAISWGDETLLDNIVVTSQLNDEIEIIEEKPKKIEEFGYCCVNANGETRNFVDVEEVLKNRINELTKAVNYLLEKESDK